MGGVSKYTYEYIKKYIKEKGCTLLSSEYINVDTKLEIVFTCGHKDKRRFYNFKNGHKYLCKKCSGGERYSLEDIGKFLEEAELTYISGEYVSNQEKLFFMDSLGYKYHVSLSGIQQYIRNKKIYKKCSIAKFDVSNMYTFENISNWIKIEKKKFDLIGGEFLGAKKKTLLLKCKECGHEWLSHWNHIGCNKGCPMCNFSKGEIKVKNFLELNKIKYEFEYKFLDCANILPLSFDFYLPLFNVLIEFQGKQHYEPVCFDGTDLEKAQLNFEYGQKNDCIKKDYCEENNILLIEIPYWEFKNIESILTEKLGLRKEAI